MKTEKPKSGITVENAEMEDVEWKKVEPTRNPAFTFMSKGDFLIGRYISFESNVGPNSSMLYSVEDESGKTWVVWGSEVLDKRMQEIKPGSLIKIVFLETRTSKKTGHPYSVFEVYTK